MALRCSAQMSSWSTASPARVRPASIATRQACPPAAVCTRPSRAGCNSAAFGPGQWSTLCRIVGQPNLDRHDTVADRVAARGEIEPILEEAFRARTAHAWQAILSDAGVAVEVSIDTNDGELVLYDADNERLGLVAEYAHPTLGKMRRFGTLVNFSETPTGPYDPAPLMGQHTRPLLLRLGYSLEEIDDLSERGIIYETGADYRFAQ